MLHSSRHSRQDDTARFPVWLALAVAALPAGWWLLRVLGGAEPVAALRADAGLFLYMGLAMLAVLLLDRRIRPHCDGLRDPLTGVFAAEYFARRIQDELAHARRKGRPLAVLRLDVDGLQRVNRQFGRARGDAVLRKVAHQLLQQVREDDTVARTGSDTFSIILRESGLEDAMQVAERMRKGIEAATHKAGQGRVFAVTASIGVVSYWRSGVVDPETLIGLLDDALGQAQRRGGNQAVAVGHTRRAEVAATVLPVA